MTYSPPSHPKNHAPPPHLKKKEVGVHFVQIFFSFSNVCFLIAYFDIFIHLFFIGLVSWWLFCVFVFLMLFFVCVCVSIVCICGYILFCFFLLVLVFGLWQHLALWPFDFVQCPSERLFVCHFFEGDAPSVSHHLVQTRCQVSLSQIWNSRGLNDYRSVMENENENTHAWNKKVLVLPLLIGATIEEKTNARVDWRHLTYQWRPQIVQEKLDSRIKTRHNQHRKWRADWKSWQCHWFTDVSYYWDELWLFEIDMAVVMWCPIGFTFCTFCTLKISPLPCHQQGNLNP